MQVCRPYFQLAESFCKGFGVEGGPVKIPEKDFLPIEEMNFSKAAIRSADVQSHQLCTVSHLHSSTRIPDAHLHAGEAIT